MTAQPPDIEDSASVAATASVGLGAHVGAHALVEAGVTIGANSVIGHGAVVCADSEVGADVRIGVHAIVGVELVGVENPAAQTRVGSRVSIGAGAIIGRGVVVGRAAVVSPASVVYDAVPAHAMVRGNPATITGYVTPAPSKLRSPLTTESSSSAELSLPGVRLVSLTRANDLRGSLMATEFSQLPFVPQRIFSVFDVPNERIRGSHAHKECAQLLICLSGSLSCIVDNGSVREEVELNSPERALLVPPLVWATQYKYLPETVLLVLASHPYDPDDYVRDYDEFATLVGVRDV